MESFLFLWCIFTADWREPGAGKVGRIALKMQVPQTFVNRCSKYGQAFDKGAVKPCAISLCLPFVGCPKLSRRCDLYFFYLRLMRFVQLYPGSVIVPSTNASGSLLRPRFPAPPAPALYPSDDVVSVALVTISRWREKNAGAVYNETVPWVCLWASPLPEVLFYFANVFRCDFFERELFVRRSLPSAFGPPWCVENLAYFFLLVICVNM